MNAPGRVAAWRYRLRRLFRVRHVEVDGFRLIAYRSDIPKHVSSLLVRGDYEVPERAAIAALVRKGDRVLEIGSCIGLVALTAARIAGAKNVLTFEPNTAAAAVARENFAANGLSIILVEAAVGAAAGALDLNIDRTSWLGASALRILNGTTLSVEMKAIGDVVAAFAPTILVLDAEGMEQEILPACPLQGIRAVVVEIHDDIVGPDGHRALQDCLTRQNFTRRPDLSADMTDVWERPAF